MFPHGSYEFFIESFTIVSKHTQKHNTKQQKQNTNNKTTISRHNHCWSKFYSILVKISNYIGCTYTFYLSFIMTSYYTMTIKTINNSQLPC